MGGIKNRCPCSNSKIRAIKFLSTAGRSGNHSEDIDLYSVIQYMKKDQRNNGSEGVKAAAIGGGGGVSASGFWALAYER